MTWEAVLKKDITEIDIHNMNELLESEILEMMVSISNEYGIGASTDSFYMTTVNEGIDKILEAMLDYAENKDGITIER